LYLKFKTDLKMFESMYGIPVKNSEFIIYDWNKLRKLYAGIEVNVKYRRDFLFLELWDVNSGFLFNRESSDNKLNFSIPVKFTEIKLLETKWNKMKHT